MAKKQVRWTLRAINDKRAIYQYWIERNKSNACSLKSDILFAKTANLLSEFPNLGVMTNYKDIKVKTIKEYQLFYKIQDDSIVIITEWDSRRNPEKRNL